MKFFENISKMFFPVILILLGLSFVVLPFIIPYGNAATESPSLSVTISSTLTLTVPVTSIALPALTPGSPVSTTSTSTIATNNSTGFNFSLNRDDPDTTLDLSTDATTNIADKTAWSPGASTSTVGNAATYSGTGMAFRVPISGTGGCAQAETWWGTDSAQLHAGIPPATQEIADCSVYQGSSNDVVISYRLDVPATQKTGSYTGSVTYTALANP